MALTVTQAAEIGAAWNPTIPMPVWLTGKSYQVGDCVVHSNAMYIAIAPSQGSAPPSANWLVVLQGA